MSTYTSKREQIRDLINEIFFPQGRTGNDLVELSDLHFQALMGFGASEGMVDQVLQKYIDKGYLRVKKGVVAITDDGQEFEVES